MKRSYKLQVLFTSIGLIAICLIIMILVVNFSGSKKEDTNGIIKNSLTDENDTLKLTGKLPISDFVVKTKDVLTFDEGVVDYVGFNVTSQGYNGDFTIFVDDCNNCLRPYFSEEPDMLSILYHCPKIFQNKEPVLNEWYEGEDDTYWPNIWICCLSDNNFIVLDKIEGTVKRK